MKEKNAKGDVMKILSKPYKIIILCVLLVTFMFVQPLICSAYDTTVSYPKPEVTDVTFEEQGKILHDGDILHVSLEIKNNENIKSISVSFWDDAFDGEMYIDGSFSLSPKGISENGKYVFENIRVLNDSLPEINYFLVVRILDKSGSLQTIKLNQYNFVYSNNCYNGIHTGGTATCKSKAKCIVCNREYGNIGTHSYSTTYTTDKEATPFSTGQESLHCEVCGAIKPNSQRSIAKLKVTLNATTATLQIKMSSTALKVTSLSSGDSILKWESSNPKVVSVNSKTGKITGKKKGTAIITVTTQGGATAKCRVKVQKGIIKTTKIAFTKKTINLKKGQKLQLKFNRKPITANDSLTYTSSDEKVVIVTGRGKITAKKKGTATITVKTASGKKSKCKIIVK